MKRIISIFLAFMLLLGSSGIAYSRHLCGGMEMISKITVGEHDLSCEMDEKPAADCPDQDSEMDEHHCCENIVTKIQTDENFAKASFDTQLNNPFVAAFVSVFILQLQPEIPVEDFSLKTYFPPIIEQDLNILYDTFLI